MWQLLRYCLLAPKLHVYTEIWDAGAQQTAFVPRPFSFPHIRRGSKCWLVFVGPIQYHGTSLKVPVQPGRTPLLRSPTLAGAPSLQTPSSRFCQNHWAPGFSSEGSFSLSSSTTSVGLLWVLSHSSAGSLIQAAHVLLAQATPLMQMSSAQPQWVLPWNF